MLPSSDKLNMVKMPRTTNRTPRNTARSLTVQSMSKMRPPAMRLAMPLMSNSHQPLLTDLTASRAQDHGASGLVTSMVLLLQTTGLRMIGGGALASRGRVCWDAPATGFT